MINKLRKRTVRDLFYSHKGTVVNKWDHYLDIYERHFRKYRGKKVTIVEFGVSEGGSLQLWRNYFGNKARIIGVDINPECEQFNSKNTEIYIGDQADKQFLARLATQIGSADIIIDDGGHTTKQQTTTFNAIYPVVKSGGVYLVEDLHTNYWKEYGGGYLRNTTFIELAKRSIDQLNAWYSRDNKQLKVNEFTKTTRSIHFYDSIVVFEKDEVKEPFHLKKGKQVLTQHVAVPRSKNYTNPWAVKKS